MFDYENLQVMDSKVKSMLAHFTPLGWILAFILNRSERDLMTSFYLRQSLGLFICFGVARLVPDYYIFVWGVLFVFWIYSFVGTVKGEQSLIPLLGGYFQKWFESIS